MYNTNGGFHIMMMPFWNKYLRLSLLLAMLLQCGYISTDCSHSLEGCIKTNAKTKAITVKYIIFILFIALDYNFAVIFMIGVLFTQTVSRRVGIESIQLLCWYLLSHCSSSYCQKLLYGCTGILSIVDPIIIHHIITSQSFYFGNHLSSIHLIVIYLIALLCIHIHKIIFLK